MNFFNEENINEIVKNIKKKSKLMKIPDPLLSDNLTEEERFKLQEEIEKTDNGFSFIRSLEEDKDFSNPEYLNDLIKKYHIDEISTNFDCLVYNPHDIACNPFINYENIAKEQNLKLINLKKDNFN